MASEIRVNTINNRSGLGTISITNSGAVFSGVTTFAQIKTTSGEVTVGTGASVYSPATNVLALGTNNAERLRITSNGDIEFGNENNKGIYLNDHSSGDRKKTLITTSDYGDYNRKKLLFCLENTQDYSNADSSDVRMTIQPNGKVGIGSETPTEVLDVSGTSDMKMVVQTKSSGAGSNAGVRIATGDGYKWLLQVGDSTTAGGLRIYQETSGSNGERLRIHSDGQIQAGTSSPTYLKYTGTATPYNNNCSTLFGTTNIGLAGQNSTINWPSDHSTADNTQPWYMMGRPHGTTDRWSFVTRPGGSNNRYNIIDCYNNANGTIESLRFSTNAGNERLRITSDGNIGVGGITTPTFTTGGGIHLADAYGIGFGNGDNGRPDFQIVYDTGQNNGLQIRCGNGADTADVYFTTAGNLAFASGKGIDFSATSNGSGTTGSELLDDYEEGNWIPSIDGLSNSPSYSNLAGRYTKIGRVVVLKMLIQPSTSPTFSNTSNFFLISGIPFTSGNNNAAYFVAQGGVRTHSLDFTSGSNNASGATASWLTAGLSSDKIVLMANVNNSAWGEIRNSMFHNKLWILELQITYHTDQ